MKSSTVLSILAGVLAVTAKQIPLNIPQTEVYVASALSQFASYTAYVAPTHATPQAQIKPAVTPSAGQCAFWMEDIKHQGIAAFNSNSNYTVFRNVKSYGAKGDGVTDDTAAIQSAISSGSRQGPGSGISSTNTPAVVYFPAGTYLISSSLIDYYYTQIIGNPNCMPVLKATPGFSGFGLIDGDQYGANGLGFGATNVFWRQVRNFVFDMTSIPASSAVTGIHWPTAQATSLQNILFLMSDAPGSQHQGVFIEQGSGGWMTDLVFQGGLYGMNQGNQQFSMRNLTFSNCVTAINQIWDWGWTYTGLNINNCSLALNMTSGGSTAQSVASVVIIDSVISNTRVGIMTAHSANSLPAGSGSLILENVQLKNVPIAVQSLNGSTVLAGSSGQMTIPAWAQGHRYNPKGPVNLLGQSIKVNPRPSALLTGTIYYQRSKPQYANIPATSFISVRTTGAVGNGVADDTTAVQKCLTSAVSAGKICFFDAGTYRVTKTITIPAGSKVVGESYSVILSSGSFFNSLQNQQPVVQVGNAGQSGQVEWSDMIVSTQGPQAGAILIQWNLASPATAPSGMWDVHTRIGGFIGSNLQGNICPTTNTTTITSANYVRNCIAAFMSMHIAPSASGLYMENNWLWTADHDVDTNYGGNQITVYTGRGLLCESTAGTIWMYGTAVEHHALYQYQFLNTKNIVLSQIQTETAYYQPNPNATIPFPPIASLSDPTFPTTPYTTNTSGYPVPNAEGWGLRVLNSQDILFYGVGLYSFFNNYSTVCSNQGNESVCQSRILQLSNSTAYIYDLHTIGTRVMIKDDAKDIAYWQDNQAGFSEELAVFKP